jgi:hypothetical protein
MNAVAYIRTNYPLAEMPISWHFAADSKSVRNKGRKWMRRTLDFAGNLPFSQWSGLLKDQVEHLLVAATAHDAAPTGTTRLAANESLDRIDSLLRAARRRLGKGDDP